MTDRHLEMLMASLSHTQEAPRFCRVTLPLRYTEDVYIRHIIDNIRAWVPRGGFITSYAVHSHTMLDSGSGEGTEHFLAVHIGYSGDR